MELGLGFALAEATWRESESVQCRRGEELARDPLIHPRTVLGRSKGSRGSSESMARGRWNSEGDDRDILQVTP